MDIDVAKNKIINHNIKKQKEEENKQLKIKKQSEDYKEQIRALKPRISKIIEIGNLCIENNIKIGESYYKRTYDDGCFEAEGIHHQLGFYRNHYSYSTYECTEYDYIGFEHGGFCGDWDFVTNGEDIFEILEEENRITSINDNSTFREPTIYHMSKFIENFDNFEKEFYRFINDL